MDTNYVIQNIKGFDFNTFCKAMKVRYGKYEDFIRNNKTVPSLAGQLKDLWDDIRPLTAQEAFKESNQEKKRVLFSCIGPKRLFEEIKPTLIDRQILQKKNNRWNEKSKPYIDDIEDIYELYEVDEKSLFPEKYMDDDDLIKSHNEKYRVVRCWCTSTKREYWIWVDSHINDAIEAICWTMQTSLLNPEAIYRQGDVLIFKLPKKPKYGEYGRKKPITKEQYIKLMNSET